MSITTEIILKLTAGSSTTQFLTYAAKVIEAAERMQPKIQEFDVECVYTTTKNTYTTRLWRTGVAGYQGFWFAIDDDSTVHIRFKITDQWVLTDFKNQVIDGIGNVFFIPPDPDYLKRRQFPVSITVAGICIDESFRSRISLSGYRPCWQRH